MPALDLEAMAVRVRELEQEAEAVHLQAQSFNKEGRFAEAQEAYARMHALEDQASQMAKEVGCVACVLGDPSCGTSAVDPKEAALYFDLQPLPSWPQDQGPGSTVAVAAAAVRQRAAGAVLGSLTADAAAMGVHWIYDLQLLERLLQEREAQHAQPAAVHDILNGKPAGPGMLTVVTKGGQQQQQQQVDQQAVRSSTIESGATTMTSLLSESAATTMASLLSDSSSAALLLTSSSITESVAPTLTADAAQQEHPVHCAAGNSLQEKVKQANGSQVEEAQQRQLEQLHISVLTTSEQNGHSQGQGAGNVPEGVQVEGVGLEFVDPPRSPFYSYPSGRNSPYGEQTLVLLRSIASSKGLDCVHYTHAFAAYFGEGFDGYRDVSTKGFLRGYARGLVPPETGAPDAQANCIARAAPLVAGWAGHPELMTVVRCATRVTQNSDAATAWAATGAAILERVVLGAAPSVATLQTIHELEDAAADGTHNRLRAGEMGVAIAQHLRQALRFAASDVPLAVADLGRNCHMPNALTSPLQVALHMEYQTRKAAAAAAAGAGSSPEGPSPSLVAAVEGARQALDQAAATTSVLSNGSAGIMAAGANDGVRSEAHSDRVVGNGHGVQSGVEEPGSAEPGVGDALWPDCMGPDAPWDAALARALGARYAQGVRAAIQEGGCCASRASYTGALLGACAGIDGLPSSWAQRYGAAAQVVQAVQAICVARDEASQA